MIQALTADGALKLFCTIAESGLGILDVNTTQVQIVNSTTETALYSVTIPAGVLDAGNMALFMLAAKFFNNSGASQSILLDFDLGGTEMWKDTSANIAVDATHNRTVYIFGALLAAGSEKIQKLGAAVFISRPGTPTTGEGALTSLSADNHYGLPIGSASVDMGSERTFTISAKFGAASANLSITKEWAFMAVIRQQPT